MTGSNEPRNPCCAGTSRLLWVLSVRLWSFTPLHTLFGKFWSNLGTHWSSQWDLGQEEFWWLCTAQGWGSNSTSVTCWVTSATYHEVPLLPFPPLCKMLIVPWRDLVKLQITETLCINVLLQSQHSTSYLFLLYVFPASLSAIKNPLTRKSMTFSFSIPTAWGG